MSSAFHEGSDFSYQPEPGVWNEAAFENLDRVIAMAGHRNIRLMLGLVDNWGHNGGMFKYMEWVLNHHPESLPAHLQSPTNLGSVPLHDEFFVNTYARQWYKDYVTTLLTRTNSVTRIPYKDDPTIFAWEIVNEPRCETDMAEGRPYGKRVHDFIREMSDFVRTLDPNHLLAAGEEGGYVTTFSNATARGYYQPLPRNCWLYGLRGDTDSGAGAMADFVSDYRSDNHTVEWVKEHTRDAHKTIGKPIVLEEFGIHAFGWAYQGFYGQIQNMPVPKYYEADRVDVYREIYSYVEDFDLDGSFFWNLGYRGMWEDPWYLCEEVGGWWADTGWSDATGIGTDTNHVIQGERSLELAYDPAKGHGGAAFCLITNEQWVVRLVGGQATGVNRVKYFWNVYNPGTPVNVAIAIRVYDPWGAWYESAAQTVTTGWNRVRFDLSAGTWKSEETGWAYNGFIRLVLEDVRQVVFLVYGDNGAGKVYLDNVTIRRDDGFIIYEEDPVCSVIRDHADVMREKRQGYAIHLAYALGEDDFPQATAEQSNYTAAASMWMVSRYLNGASFTQTQAQIYSETTHDPAHNNEITPWSCAYWTYTHAPAGYYFSGRWRPSLEEALREVVYWVDYVPAGGRRTPTFLLCGTNWSYKVVRGFQASRKPYDGGYYPATNNVFALYGFWLNDPRVQGLGYNLYATAAEMTNIFLASTANSQFWIVAEPPQDGALVAAAADTINRTTMEIAPPPPNPDLAARLIGRPPPSKKLGSGGAGGELLDSIPPALRNDAGFMAAFNAAPAVHYYAVNTNRPDAYFLAVGGVRGPASTRYVLKLATDGSLRQATWCDPATAYEPLPLQTAEWAARRSLGEAGASAVLEESALTCSAGASPFDPRWEMTFDVDGTPVFCLVGADVNLSGDADDDGMTDGEELYAGSDPDNGLSLFIVEGGRAVELGADRISLRWTGAPGRTYSIYRSTRLSGGFVPVATRVSSAHPEENVYVDTMASGTVFYRISAE